MKVYIERENKTKDVKAKTIKEILEKLNINPVTVLTVVNDELVTEDRRLSSDDKVKLLEVVSGG